MSRFHIGLGDVIGHNESLTSRFHHELYAGWRCQTHADWNRTDMASYRARLAAARQREGVPLGGRCPHGHTELLTALRQSV